jgi:hypothetical protein
MSKPDDRSIVVKVEVHVPWLDRPAIQDRKHRFFEEGISIFCPGAGALTPVCVASGSKTICTRGTAIDPDTNQPAQRVFVKVFSVTDQIPGDPSALSGVISGPPDNQGNWLFDGVPGAICPDDGSMPTANNNQVAVWAQFANTLNHTNVFFKGYCSDHTDCCLSGSGSGATLVAQPRLGEVSLALVLYVTFSGGTDRCKDVNGMTVPVSWLPAARHWEGWLVVPGLGSTAVILSCEGEQLRLRFGQGVALHPTSPLVAAPGSREPLLVTYTPTFSGGWSGSITITITDH